MAFSSTQFVAILLILSCLVGALGIVLRLLLQTQRALEVFLTEARRIDRTDLALEVAKLEGKKYGVNIAQIREVLHSVLVLLAKESPGSVNALLERVRKEEQKGNCA